MLRIGIKATHITTDEGIVYGIQFDWPDGAKEFTSKQEIESDPSIDWDISAGLLNAIAAYEEEFKIAALNAIAEYKKAEADSK